MPVKIKKLRKIECIKEMKEYTSKHKGSTVYISKYGNSGLLFKNGKTIDLLSTRMRKSFEEYVLNCKN